MKTRHLSMYKSSDLETAGRIIRSGGLVVFPTETVYGLGANALDAGAVSRIFEAKGRPADNPVIVHIADLSDLPRVALLDNKAATVLAEAFMPGPFTLVLPKRSIIPGEVSAGLGTVGVRIPGLEAARNFIRSAGCPIAAPSANRSGRPSPTSFRMAWDELDGKVDAILEGPAAQEGIESTIVWCREGGVVQILRPGSISSDAIGELLRSHGLPDAIVKGSRKGEENESRSPGTRYRHYSPGIPVLLWNNHDDLRVLLRGAEKPMVLGTADALKAFPRDEFPAFQSRVFKDLRDYARQLYASFADADGGGMTSILAWIPDDRGLGSALADRLQRAAGKVGD